MCTIDASECYKSLILFYDKLQSLNYSDGHLTILTIIVVYYHLILILKNKVQKFTNINVILLDCHIGSAELGKCILFDLLKLLITSSPSSPTSPSPNHYKEQKSPAIYRKITMLTCIFQQN